MFMRVWCLSLPLPLCSPRMSILSLRASYPPPADIPQKILSEVMASVQRPISNVELNNCQTIGDVLELVQRPAINIVKERTVPLEKRLKAMDLPPNMQWIPSDKRLRQLRGQYRRQNQ